MIVQELVGLGSLLNYLLENSQTISPNSELKIWASQIACGNYNQANFNWHIIHMKVGFFSLLQECII